MSILLPISDLLFLPAESLRMRGHLPATQKTAFPKGAVFCMILLQNKFSDRILKLFNICNARLNLLAAVRHSRFHIGTAFGNVCDSVCRLRDRTIDLRNGFVDLIHGNRQAVNRALYLRHTAVKFFCILHILFTDP